MIYGIVYVATNKLNGKQYVGQTTHNNPLSYWRNHISSAKRGDKKYLYRAIAKYGSDAFTFEVIFEARDRAELDAKEDEVILLRRLETGTHMDLR